MNDAGQLKQQAGRPGEIPASRPAHRNVSLGRAAGVLAAFLLSGGGAVAQRSGADQLRQFIDQQVGGIQKLKVPATDAEIPLPTPPVGQMAYRYQTTEAKRYLGKLLFHDPVRTARIDTTYGGVRATAQTGSCGSCHLGEASGKAGAQFNFNVGGEGRGYKDELGNFIARRRPRTDLLKQQRTAQLFPGDALVDLLPTLTDVLSVPNPTCTPGAIDVTTPARGHKTPAPCETLATGRLDPLDSVGRQSPSMVGFAFNNRLLFGGFAGEPDSEAGGLNPLNDPAQENLTLLLLDAHRMLTDAPASPGESPSGDVTLNGQAPVLQKIPAFVKLFMDAFPQEAATYAKSGNIGDLVNDDTVLRATSTFLRTVITRNTPFDYFLAGDDRALTARQRRGAKLFFTPAAGGAGGAGCFVCHSGPMLNKQYNDPDVAGTGQFVEENFVNVGIGDHPLQALNRAAAQAPDQSRHDFGRQEITGDPNAAFKFRVLTLRQLKEAVTFFHDGAPRFSSLRDVVEYFNAGVPEDPITGSAPTLDIRFTNPRGPGYPDGLGLTEAQVDDLTDFLENGLYDPALSHYDPASSTRLFELDPQELAYSKNRPDLSALGAKDGMVLSGLAMNNNDPLTRRDEGFEFLDVTSRLGTALVGISYPDSIHEKDVVELTNISTPSVTAPGVIDSGSVIDTNLLIVVRGLDPAVRLTNASGKTSGGDPYVRVFLQNGVLQAGEKIVQPLLFDLSGYKNPPPVSYSFDFLSGQGNP